MSIDPNSTRGRLVNIIVDVLDIRESEIVSKLEKGEDIDFEKDLIVDSLDLTEIVLEVETEFDIDLPDDQIKKISTFIDLEKFIILQNSKK